MKNRSLYVGLMMAVSLTANAFEADGGYASLAQEVFTPNCVVCHSGPEAAGKVDLSSYSALMASQIVVPGNPSQSRLYRAVATGQMPQGGSPLAAAQIAAIADWISAGAPQN